MDGLASRTADLQGKCPSGGGVIRFLSNISPEVGLESWYFSKTAANPADLGPQTAPAGQGNAANQEDCGAVRMTGDVSFLDFRFSTIRLNRFPFLKKKSLPCQKHPMPFSHDWSNSRPSRPGISSSLNARGQQQNANRQEGSHLRTWPTYVVVVASDETS